MVRIGIQVLQATHRAGAAMLLLGLSLSTAYPATPSVVVADFQVNEEINQGGSAQYTNPYITSLTDSSVVTVWEFSTSTIYYQHHDQTGVPIAGPLLVNDTYTGNRNNPCAAGLTGGGFVAAWQDGRNGSGAWDIYVQVYDDTLAAVGGNFTTKSMAHFTQTYPAIAATADSGFVVVWQDDSTGNYNINARRYDAAGTTVGDFFRVDDDTGTSPACYPSVSAIPGGGFVVAWQDYRDGDHNIYAQRFDAAGSALGANFKVNDDATAENQEQVAVAALEGGGFVVSWIDQRSFPNWDLYAQEYDKNGATVGSNFKVNDVDIAGIPYGDVAALTGGGYALTWQDPRTGSTEIYAQLYDNSGNPAGANFQVSNYPGPSHLLRPHLTSTAAGGFWIVWMGRYSYTDRSDVFAQRYDAAGTALGDNFLMHYGGLVYQRNPAIEVLPQGRFAITWEDPRKGNIDIFLQLFDDACTADGSNIQLNVEWGDPYGDGYPGQSDPQIAANSHGALLVGWTDPRASSNYSSPDKLDIYLQRLDPSGVIAGNNIAANSAGGYVYSSSSVAATSDGGFITVWSDLRDGNPDIYGQRLDSEGVALGSNFRIDDDAGTSNASGPAADGLTGGGFVVAWSDWRNGNYDIYAQRYDSTGVAVGGNFRADTSSGTINSSGAAVAALAGGGFVVAWHEYRDGSWECRFQQYDAAGAQVGGNTNATADVPGTAQYPTVAALGDGGFVIGWQNYQDSDYAIYAQRYSAAGTPVENSFAVTGVADGFIQNDPALAANGHFLYSAWEDNRVPDHGVDIFANLLQLADLPPTQPQGVNAQAGEGEVQLSWQPVPDADLSHYVVYQSTTPGFSPSAADSIAVPQKSDTSLAVPGLLNDTTYYFLMEAVDAGGNRSAMSAQVSATPADMTPPAAPQGLTAQPGDSSAVLTWRKNAESDILRYRVYLSFPPLPMTLIDSTAGAADTTITITGLVNGQTYEMEVTVVDGSLNESDPSNRITVTPAPLSVNRDDVLPTEFALRQNYPNPFNPTTMVEFDLPEAADVMLIVYDLMGREVSRLKEEQLAAGYYHVIWNARDGRGRQVPTGIYIARLVTSEYTKAIKMLLLK